MRTIGTAAILTAMWLLMSGLYKPMLLAFCAVSVLLVVVVMHRMDAVDDDRVPITVKPLGFAAYLLWLLKEIAKSNWAVTKVILRRDMPIRQHLFVTPYTQKSDLGQVIFANSITLTPGTISVECEQGHFLVHALVYDDDVDPALADMDARVTAIESEGA